MRRHLLLLALTGAIGASLLTSEASACHKKKKCDCAPVAACPAPVAYVPPPCPPPAPVCEPCPPPKKKCALFSMFKKKPKCEPVACATPCPAPVSYYSAPAPYYAPAPSGQYMGSGQSMSSQQGY